MGIILGAIDKFSAIKDNAYKVRKYQDSIFPPTAKDLQEYRIYIQNKSNNPTIGMITENTFFGTRSNYPKNSKYNRTILDRKTFDLRLALEIKLHDMYPKTRKIREYIANTGRLHLDYVKKTQGYDFIDKIVILLRK